MRSGQNQMIQSYKGRVLLKGRKFSIISYREVINNDFNLVFDRISIWGRQII